MHAGAQGFLAESRQRGGGSLVHRADAAAAVRKGPGIPHAQDGRQRVIDAALGRVQVGVHADGRDALLHQQRGHIPRRQRLDGVENDRVVGDNQLAAQRGGLPHHLGGDVQRSQNTGDRAAGIHQQPHVVPVLGQLRRRKAAQLVQHLLYGYSHPFSSILLKPGSRRQPMARRRASSPSTASASGPGARPRRYFSTLGRCWAR